jgi:hypothetical protein
MSRNLAASSLACCIAARHWRTGNPARFGIVPLRGNAHHRRSRWDEWLVRRITAKRNVVAGRTDVAANRNIRNLMTPKFNCDKSMRHEV